MGISFQRVLIFSAMASASSCLWAQDETGNIDTSVDVVNAYQPTLRRASKVATVPTVNDTVQFRNSFNYQLLNRVEAVVTKPDTLSAASMDFPEYGSPYRALLQAGVGSLPSFFGQLTYNTGASERYRLALSAGHRALLGKVKLDNDEKVDAPKNDTWAGVNFHRFYENVRFGFNFSFKNSAYRFYGLNSIVDSLQYVLEDGGSVAGGELSRHDKQRLTSGDLDFSVGNSMADPSEKFTFFASFGVGVWATKFGVHQTDVRVGGALRFPMNGASALNVDLAVHTFKASGGDSDSVYLFLDRKGVDVKVYPHFLLGYDYMNLSIGLRLISVIGDDYTKDDFIVQPDLNADFFIGDGSVRFYAGLSGDYTANSYRHLTEVNNYISPDFRKYIWSRSLKRYVTREEIRPSQSPILFKLGARSSFGKTVQLHLGLDFRSLGDEVFFVNRNFAQADDTVSFSHSSQFALLQDDGKLFRLHGEININPTENSNVRIQATYNKYSMDYLDEAWNRPSFLMTVAGHFKPVERLKVRASLDVTGKRKAFDPSRRTAVDLKSYVDLNVGANYYISNRWTAFLDLNNLCCADQQDWLGYSSRRLSAMAGITYKF